MVEMLNQVQHDGFLYPLILKKSSVGKSKIFKKTLDKKFFFFLVEWLLKLNLQGANYEKNIY